AELFGERLGMSVAEEAKRVKAAQQAQARALKDAGLKSQEFLQQQQAAQAKARTEAREAFNRVSQELGAKFADLYLPAPNDKEAIEARRAAESLANLVLEGQPADMPHETYLASIAKVHHRAA